MKSEEVSPRKSQATDPHKLVSLTPSLKSLTSDEEVTERGTSNYQRSSTDQIHEFKLDSVLANDFTTGHQKVADSKYLSSFTKSPTGLNMKLDSCVDKVYPRDLFISGVSPNGRVFNRILTAYNLHRSQPECDSVNHLDEVDVHSEALQTVNTGNMTEEECSTLSPSWQEFDSRRTSGLPNWSPSTLRYIKVNLNHGKYQSWSRSETNGEMTLTETVSQQPLTQTQQSNTTKTTSTTQEAYTTRRLQACSNSPTANRITDNNNINNKQNREFKSHLVSDDRFGLVQSMDCDTNDTISHDIVTNSKSSYPHLSVDSDGYIISNKDKNKFLLPVKETQQREKDWNNMLEKVRNNGTVEFGSDSKLISSQMRQLKLQNRYKYPRSISTSNVSRGHNLNILEASNSSLDKVLTRFSKTDMSFRSSREGMSVPRNITQSLLELNNPRHLLEDCHSMNSQSFLTSLSNHNSETSSILRSKSVLQKGVASSLENVAETKNILSRQSSRLGIHSTSEDAEMRTTYIVRPTLYYNTSTQTDLTLDRSLLSDSDVISHRTLASSSQTCDTSSRLRPSEFHEAGIISQNSSKKLNTKGTVFQEKSVQTTFPGNYNSSSLSLNIDNVLRENTNQNRHDSIHPSKEFSHLQDSVSNSTIQSHHDGQRDVKTGLYSVSDTRYETNKLLEDVYYSKENKFSDMSRTSVSYHESSTRSSSYVENHAMYPSTIREIQSNNRVSLNHDQTRRSLLRQDDFGSNTSLTDSRLDISSAFSESSFPSKDHSVGTYSLETLYRNLHSDQHIHGRSKSSSLDIEDHQREANTLHTEPRSDAKQFSSESGEVVHDLSLTSGLGSDLSSMYSRPKSSFLDRNVHPSFTMESSLLSTDRAASSCPQSKDTTYKWKKVVILNPEELRNSRRGSDSVFPDDADDGIDHTLLSLTGESTSGQHITSPKSGMSRSSLESLTLEQIQEELITYNSGSLMDSNNNTPSVASTFTSTHTPSVSSVFSNIHTPSVASTFTSTHTPSVSSTFTSTHTPSVSSTFTSTHTPSVSSVFSSIHTPSVSSTFTSTHTPSVASTFTSTHTPSVSSTFTSTHMPSVASTFTAIHTPSVSSVFSSIHGRETDSKSETHPFNQNNDLLTSNFNNSYRNFQQTISQQSPKTEPGFQHSVDNIQSEILHKNIHLNGSKLVLSPVLQNYNLPVHSPRSKEEDAVTQIISKTQDITFPNNEPHQNINHKQLILNLDQQSIHSKHPSQKSTHHNIILSPQDCLSPRLSNRSVSDSVDDVISQVNKNLARSAQRVSLIRRSSSSSSRSSLDYQDMARPERYRRETDWTRIRSLNSLSYSPDSDRWSNWSSFDSENLFGDIRTLRSPTPRSSFAESRERDTIQNDTIRTINVDNSLVASPGHQSELHKRGHPLPSSQSSVKDSDNSLVASPGHQSELHKRGHPLPSSQSSVKDSDNSLVASPGHQSELHKRGHPLPSSQSSVKDSDNSLVASPGHQSELHKRGHPLPSSQSSVKDSDNSLVASPGHQSELHKRGHPLPSSQSSVKDSDNSLVASPGHQSELHKRGHPLPSSQSSVKDSDNSLVASPGHQSELHKRGHPLPSSQSSVKDSDNSLVASPGHQSELHKRGHPLPSSQSSVKDSDNSLVVSPGHQSELSKRSPSSPPPLSPSYDSKSPALPTRRNRQNLRSLNEGVSTMSQQETIKLSPSEKSRIHEIPLGKQQNDDIGVDTSNVNFKDLMTQWKNNSPQENSYSVQTLKRDTKTTGVINQYHHRTPPQLKQPKQVNSSFETLPSKTNLNLSFPNKEESTQKQEKTLSSPSSSLPSPATSTSPISYAIFNANQHGSSSSTSSTPSQHHPLVTSTSTLHGYSSSDSPRHHHNSNSNYNTSSNVSPTHGTHSVNNVTYTSYNNKPHWITSDSQNAPSSAFHSAPSYSSQSAPFSSSHTSLFNASHTAPFNSSQSAPFSSSQTSLSNASHTATSNASQTAQFNSSQSAPFSSSQTSLFNSSHTATSNVSQTAPFNSSQSAPFSSSQTSLFNSPHAATSNVSQTAPFNSSQSAPFSSSQTSLSNASQTVKSNATQIATPKLLLEYKRNRDRPDVLSKTSANNEDTNSTRKDTRDPHHILRDRNSSDNGTLSEIHHSPSYGVQSGSHVQPIEGSHERLTHKSPVKTPQPVQDTQVYNVGISHSAFQTEHSNERLQESDRSAEDTYVRYKNRSSRSVATYDRSMSAAVLQTKNHNNSTDSTFSRHAPLGQQTWGSESMLAYPGLEDKKPTGFAMEASKMKHERNPPKYLNEASTLVPVRPPRPHAHGRHNVGQSSVSSSPSSTYPFSNSRLASVSLSALDNVITATTFGLEQSNGMIRESHRREPPPPPSSLPYNPPNHRQHQEVPSSANSSYSSSDAFTREHLSNISQSKSSSQKRAASNISQSQFSPQRRVASNDSSSYNHSFVSPNNNNTTLPSSYSQESINQGKSPSNEYIPVTLPPKDYPLRESASMRPLTTSSNIVTNESARSFEEPASTSRRRSDSSVSSRQRLNYSCLSVSSRQPSQEELECDEVVHQLAEELDGKDQKLLEALRQDANKNRTLYMNGLFSEPDNRMIPAEQPGFNNNTLSSPKSGTLPIGASNPSDVWDHFKSHDTIKGARESTTLLKHKEELVEKLHKKIEVLKADKTLLQQAIDDNDLLGQQVCQTSEFKCLTDNEKDKFKSCIDDLDKIVRLLLNLSGQLARAENAVQALAPAAEANIKKLTLQKRERLHAKHEEAKLLKEDIDKRSDQLLLLLEERFSKQELSNYKHYIHMKPNLAIQLQDVNDKITVSERQMLELARSLPRPGSGTM